jgi:tetratricopeptide (TPR) repeat protein
MSLKNIGLAYASMGQYEQARLHWERATDIYKYDRAFPQNHPDVQQLHDFLQHLPHTV